MLPSVSTLGGNFPSRKYSLSCPLSEYRWQIQWTPLSGVEWKKKKLFIKTVHFAWCMACVWGETDRAARDEQIGESFSVFFSSCTLYCFHLLAHSPQLNSPVWNLLGARAASSAKNLPIAEHWGGAWEKNLWHSCQPNLLNLFGLA